MQDGQLFTLASLATMSGASLMTFFTVQLLKNLIDKVYKFPTDALAAIVGVFWILVANIAIGADPADWRTYLLNLANGILVGLSSGKIHDITLNPPGGDKR